MYRLIYVIFLIGLLSCEKERQTRNPNLGEVHFTYTIDISLPLYNSLKTPMNTVFIPHRGIKGFIVMEDIVLGKLLVLIIIYKSVIIVCLA